MTRDLCADLFARFYDDRTGIIYSYDLPEREMALPTPAEAASGIPSAPAWGTGVEDCAMNGGLLLAALTDLGKKEAAGRIFAGLRGLLSAARVHGFVPRGLLADGVSHYANTSSDQVCMLVYGLWRYLRSPLPDVAQRAACAGMIRDIAERIEGGGLRILSEDGAVAGGGNIHSLDAGHPARLLGLLMAAYVATGEEKWRRLYEEKVSEQDGARLRHFCGESADGFPPGWGFYGPEQLQVQLRLLAESEWDPGRRDLYRRAMGDVAARMLRASFPCIGHEPAYTPETLAVLGGSTRLDSPFGWTAWRADLLARPEDWTWRGEWAGRPLPTLPEALRFVLEWMGRRPAFCHERTCVRFPLTAFHVALLAGDQNAAAECRRLLDLVDFRLCRWADTLVEATAAAALLHRAQTSTRVRDR